MDYFKQGDTIPISGEIKVFDDATEITQDQNFALWAISCKGKAKNWSHDVPLVIDAEGLFAGELSSAVTATIPAGQTVRFDIRIKDDAGVVISSQTKTLQILAPVSGVPL